MTSVHNMRRYRHPACLALVSIPLRHSAVTGRPDSLRFTSGVLACRCVAEKQTKNQRERESQGEGGGADRERERERERE